MGLNIEALRLTEDDLKGMASLDAYNYGIARALWGYKAYLETLPHGRALWMSLMTDMELANVTRPIERPT